MATLDGDDLDAINAGRTEVDIYAGRPNVDRAPSPRLVLQRAAAANQPEGYGPFVSLASPRMAKGETIDTMLHSARREAGDYLVEYRARKRAERAASPRCRFR
mgnify:CR=1 FL=1